MTRETGFLDEAVGIFEGGGVRGLAYLGAYQEALEQGLNFVGAAGTSVGSLAAALVAAGVDGERLREATDDLDLETLRGAPEEIRVLSWPDRWKGALLRLVPKWGVQAATLVDHLGHHSSEPIEAWLDDLLQATLGLSSTVRFRDLPRPLAVLATDLGNSGCKIWSRRDTPDESVAFAVRASCSIPGYFQPVCRRQGDEWEVYADGGLLANLPLSLADHLEDCEDVPLLGFRIAPVPDPVADPSGLSLRETVRRVLDATVGGGSHLQISQHPRAAVITIPAGGVGTTDFNLNEHQRFFLVEAGKKATSQFLRSPTDSQVLRSPAFAAALVRSQRGSMLEQAAEAISRAAHTIEAVVAEPRAITDFLPLALIVRRRRPSVRWRLLYSRNSQLGQAGPTSVQSLHALGIELRCSARDVLLEGVLVDSSQRWARALVIDAHEPGGGRVTRFLESTDHRGLIRLYAEHFEERWSGAVAPYPLQDEPVAPSVVPLPAHELISALREHIPAYGSATIESCSVDPAATRPLRRVLSRWMVRRVRYIQEASELYGMAFCEGAHLTSSRRISAPPVLEMGGDSLAVVRGHHRLFHCLRAGIPTVPALVVTGASQPLPTQTKRWRDVRVLTRGVSAKLDEADYAQAYHRDIGTAWARLGFQLESARPVTSAGPAVGQEAAEGLDG